MAQPRALDLDSMGENMIQHVASLYARFNGNIAQVAREIGVDRDTLTRSLDRAGLKPRSRHWLEGKDGQELPALTTS